MRPYLSVDRYAATPIARTKVKKACESTPSPPKCVVNIYSSRFLMLLSFSCSGNGSHAVTTTVHNSVIIAGSDQPSRRFS